MVKIPKLDIVFWQILTFPIGFVQRDYYHVMRNLSYYFPQHDYNHVVGNFSTGLP